MLGTDPTPTSLGREIARAAARLAALVADTLPAELGFFDDFGADDEVTANDSLARLAAAFRFSRLDVELLVTAGLAEEHRDALLAFVPGAPWLVEVVEKRGWQAEAKPFVLEAVRRARRSAVPGARACPRRRPSPRCPRPSIGSRHISAARVQINPCAAASAISRCTSRSCTPRSRSAWAVADRYCSVLP